MECNLGCISEYTQYPFRKDMTRAVRKSRRKIIDEMIYFVGALKVKGLEANPPSERRASKHGMLKWLERKKRENMVNKET